MKRAASLALAWVVAGAALAGQMPLRVHMLSGSGEYKSEQSLRKLKAYLEKHYDAICTLSLGKDKGKDLPDLDKLDQADVLVVFCRRMRLPGDQLRRIKDWCKAGKPVIGIRTASHAFQNWLEFDKIVLGGDYSGHWGNERNVPAQLEARDHPILRGVEPWVRTSKYYKNPKIAKDATVLVTRLGKHGEKLPLAWARTYEPKTPGRAFYTSMGLPEDFDNPNFLRLLANAILWTADREPQAGP